MGCAAGFLGMSHKRDMNESCHDAIANFRDTSVAGSGTIMCTDIHRYSVRVYVGTGKAKPDT